MHRFIAGKAMFSLTVASNINSHVFRFFFQAHLWIRRALASHSPTILQEGANGEEETGKQEKGSNEAETEPVMAWGHGGAVHRGRESEEEEAVLLLLCPWETHWQGLHLEHLILNHLWSY